MFGDTVTGKHQIALSEWAITLQRSLVTDITAIIDWDNEFLTVALKKSSGDIKLFLRPFTGTAWLAVLTFFIFLFMLWTFFGKFERFYKMSLITEFFGFLCFMLINAYYGSALTMYFTSDLRLPFETMEEVLKNVPAWTLIHLNGINLFTRKAREVCK